ncbi:hypothetical protein HMPREF1544_07935 [Mucor circinelloides 1006PhL]|uniref:Reverse transcriptase zinc-binding domain-containing protein n=1 Tax=Mucor circinelloides f. circinelloides (strain 1006PhL) TaxID=1220926 RepID=S2J5B4_MUCC1|nr:hypothetical protein HMPREF1544_07935 [Mucor circinelloides 1006PhL]
MRYGSPLKGQQCLLPLFRSVDAFYVEASWDNCSLSPDTLLQMPFLELCHQSTTDPSFLDHKLIFMKPTHTFLENSRLLTKIIAAVRSNTINFVPSLPCVYLSAPLGPDSLSVTNGGFDLSLYFRHKLFYQGIMILSMSNTELRRAMYMRNYPPITNPWVDVYSKVNLLPILRLLPDDICKYCGHSKTTSHMLFTCPTNFDICYNFFALVFLPLESMDMSDVSAFEAITCVITAIWHAKWWRSYYDNIAIDDQSVVDRAMSNLRNISSLNMFS